MYKGFKSVVRVLLVDDLPDARYTFAGILQDEGWNVHAVASREEALEALKKNYYSVAVLDVRLDEQDEDNQDGIALMHEIHNGSPSTAVIILTGYADVGMVQEALQPLNDGTRPAYGFLEKSQWDRLTELVEGAAQQATYTKDALVSELVVGGETDQVEFKSSLRWNQRTQKVDKRLVDAVIKTIAAFLNGKGGTLLIGVGDDGSLIGIDNDMQSLRKQSLDGFQISLVRTVQSHLDLQYPDLIHVDFESFGEVVVCVVNVQPSPEPVFVQSGNEMHFYVRPGNFTDCLNVKDAMSYIKRNFPRK